MLDTLDMQRAIDAFVRSTPGAEPAKHTFEKAVRVDRTPNQTAEKQTKGDTEHGATHPFTRYVAGSLPHLEPVGDTPSHRVRQGALEWASKTTSVTTGGFAFGSETDDSVRETVENERSETADFGGLTEVGQERGDRDSWITQKCQCCNFQTKY
jgi:hypothetical protein